MSYLVPPRESPRLDTAHRSPPAAFLSFLNKLLLHTPRRLLPFGSSPTRQPSQDHLPTMDPAEMDHLKKAFAMQGVLVSKHESTLRQVLDNLQKLAASITELGGKMDTITGQLANLSHTSSPPPPPTQAPEPPVAPRLTPQEPCIPTPARYTGQDQLSLPVSVVASFSPTTRHLLLLIRQT